MKKFILSWLAFSLFAAVQAQTFKWGPAAAGNLNLAEDTKARIGFSIGAKGEMTFGNSENGWFADASLLFNNRNFCSDNYYDLDSKITNRWKYNTCTLLIPVNFGYKFNLSDNLDLLASVGPYADFGLTGKDKVVSTDEKGNETEKKVSSNVYKDKLMNRVNAGMNVSVGLEIAKHYQITLSYSRGFTHLFKGDNRMKAQDLQLGVAYLF